MSWRGSDVVLSEAVLGLKIVLVPAPLQADFAAQQPLPAGLLDLNRYKDP